MKNMYLNKNTCDTWFEIIFTELKRKLSPESSPEPGRYSTERAPYQKEMMDVANDSKYEYIVYMTSTQIGKTTCAGGDNDED
jgi:phage terminase large subunit GpA-like protein